MTILPSPPATPASADERWPADEVLAVTGRLVVEPYLWAVDGMLWPLLPDGLRMWSVDRIHCLDADGTEEELMSLPGPSGLDHGAALLARSTAEANAVLPENASLRQVLHALRGVSTADADEYETAVRDALLTAAETLDLSEPDRIRRAARLKVVLADGQD